jgi:hypothetical protein
MPRGMRVPPGPSLYPECGTPGRRGVERHQAEGTVTCQPCRDERARAHNRYKMRRARLGTRRVDACGVRRRIRALAALGWSFPDLAAQPEMRGVHRTVPQKLTRAEVVWADTAADVRRLYDRLSMTPGGSAHAARRARKAGWLPPLAWDDERLDDPGYVPAEQILRDWDDALAENRRHRARQRRRLPEQAA